MNSRTRRDYQEESDEETDDEDYAPDVEDSEEEHEESVDIPSPATAAAESPEVEVLAVAPASERDRIEDETAEGTEEEDEEVVMEVDCNAGRKQECDESGSGTEGMDPSCLPSCPICLNPWTPDGPHRVCCIPCGHVYGRSCLERWIRQCKKNVSKCPQCSARFKKKEIINLYAPLIAVPNTDLEKEVLSLREKNESLKLERAHLLEEISKSKKMACVEVASVGALQRRLGHLDEGWISVSDPLFVAENRLMPQNFYMSDHNHDRCVLQNELSVDGARVMAIDASSRIVIISGKKPGQVGEHVLNKISLFGRHEIEQIELPPKTGAVRDLRILPGSLALIASLGKKLSLLSMSSNNLVLKYDLQVPAWSCSGDVNDPYHIYAGLQNGMLLMFDIRQTARCLESMEGSSRFPIHTISSLKKNSSTRKVLTASSAGPCLWDVGGCGERSVLIPEIESQGVCISLACGSSSNDIVASFRPKMELSNNVVPSQIPASPSQPISAAGKLGSHVHIKRISGTCFQKGNVACGYVSEVRMLKSAIICSGGNIPLFACGDESTRGVCLWNLPSFQVHSRYQSHQYPILDLKYSSTMGSGFLGCISENKLQVFTCF